MIDEDEINLSYVLKSLNYFFFSFAYTTVSHHTRDFWLLVVERTLLDMWLLLHSKGHFKEFFKVILRIIFI